jgi:hypothetical protein
MTISVATVAAIVNMCLQGGDTYGGGAVQQWFTNAAAGAQAQAALATLGGLSARQLMAILLVQAASPTKPVKPDGTNLPALLGLVGLLQAQIQANAAPGLNSPVFDLVNTLATQAS